MATQPESAGQNAALTEESGSGTSARAGVRVLDLVDVMDRLRRECPWDQRQTHQSLLRYLIEEAHEVIEAVETGDPADLREELGDLLLQVVFHARIARESADESFDIDDVAAGIVDKLVSRHPHVFAGLAVADAAEVERNWTTLKRQEKGRTSPLDGIPAGLPALSLADKVVSRLAAAGRDVSGSLEDVDRPASRGAEDSDVEAQTPEAVGHALFRIAARASLAGIDPEQALRQRVRQEMAAAQEVSQRALPAGSDSRG